VKPAGTAAQAVAGKRLIEAEKLLKLNTNGLSCAMRHTPWPREPHTRQGKGSMLHPHRLMVCADHQSVWICTYKWEASKPGGFSPLQCILISFKGSPAAW